MFDELSARFEEAVKSLKGLSAITENNVENALKQVRRALIEADVSLVVVKEFMEEVRSKSIGIEVVRGIKPDQKFIQVVYEQLIEIMGANNTPLHKQSHTVTVVLMAGLQGAGKTTAAAKLALYLKNQGEKVLMVAADVYRPAAIDQLFVLGKQIDVEVFTLNPESIPEDIAAAGLQKAIREGFDYLIVDTAGRLQIDTAMMQEMVRIRSAVNPNEILLVVDSMIGQEAAELTRAFHEQIGITGAVLTKLDGDARGGAALSIRKVSGAPIKFIGTGEKVEALQPFHPERMASRILGMGDIVTLVEKAQEEVELADVEKMQRKLQEASFDFSDFLQQMRLVKRMGSLGGLMKMIPGMNKIDSTMLREGEAQLKRIESMIGSMTPTEREKPELLASQPSRRGRIAKGSGHKIADVDKMLVDFQKMRGFMQQMTKGNNFANPLSMGANMFSQPNMTVPQTKISNTNESRMRNSRATKKKKGFGQL
uniref:signal-recognition-particle GTPase n=1 Tax=Paulinella chromatophora TaxID=39717 RepID=B1X3Q8_PAUCH|nr:signal recognition particle protein (SRP54) [Paulinella chromatophora]ACB42577.1 signal recognition particle protein (SRP54) [Paulinella chromatophora]|eukprot:gb/GEZN01000661.1/.p1 GENE.gb/GEZN01000661.1/~~gb/GEZN01000661.1/.p1  ORF type:complete len:482 (-),score=33.45 gb/GEZN01000661.1/:2376-3821(-)